MKFVYSFVALIFLGGLGMVGGGVWSYVDEHSGVPGNAKVTHCESHSIGNQSGLNCDGIWTANGRTVRGAVFNAQVSDVGKTVAVRLHGSRATVPTLWVSIALAVFGLALAASGVWMFVRIRSRARLGDVGG